MSWILCIILFNITLTATIAMYCLWRQRGRPTADTLSATHVALNAAHLLALSTCIVTHALPYSVDQKLMDALSEVPWVLCLICRLGYVVSHRHRRTLNAVSNWISLAAFIGITTPTRIYPLITIQSDRTQAIFGLIPSMNIMAAAMTSVILPLFTPFHNSGSLQEQTAVHPSSTCSPIVRWWTYGWISPFVASAYQSSGDVSQIEIPILTTKSNPQTWLWKLREARLVTNSTARAVWTLFRPRMAIMAACMILCGFAEFLGTIGLRSLLGYLEGSASDGAFQPWFAALLFGASPIVRGLCMQTFESFSTDAICHFKSMVISTIFEKLLKKRPGVQANPGQVTNHVAADIDKIAILRYTIMAGFMVPVEVIVASMLLYQTIGWSYLPGLLIIIITRIPISWYISRFQGRAQSVVMAAIDSRVHRVSEVIKGLQTIQMLGQAVAIRSWVDGEREAELQAIWNKMKIVVASDTLSAGFVLVPLVVSLFMYTMVAGLPLTPAVVFTVVSVFSTLKNMMSLAVIGVSTNAQAMVSFWRVMAFLDDESSQSDYWSDESNNIRYTDEVHPPQETLLGARNATIQVPVADGTWRTVLKNVNFDLVKGGLNVISGKTGSGKSTLLKALIQEAKVSHGRVEIRSSPFSEVSFAGQHPWLHHGTIRENILFGSTLSKSRYDDVIQSTGLSTDLLDLPAGDSTEVGERGSSLSGGQRARVALARALYARTETVLLDDVLAALDATTSRWVVEKCILGNILKGRTAVLITEDQRCCQEAALVVEISNEGQVEASRPDRFALKVRASDFETLGSRLLNNDAEAPGEVTAVTDAANELGTKPSDKSEKLMTGLIGRMYILKYMRLFGTLPFLSLFCTLILLSQASDVLLSLWLTVWSGKSVGENSQQPHNDNTFYLGVYASIGLVQISLVCVSSLVFFYGALRASRKEHSKMLASVIGATITWVTTTPVGRILNRFSSDMFSLDNTITELLKQVVENFLSIGFRLAAVSSILPAFLAPAALLLAMGLYIGQMYLYGSTAAKRIYAAGLSPILTSINDVVSGIEVIRAHRAEPAFQNRFFQSLEHYLRGWETISATQRWLAVRMDLCAGLISLLTAVLALNSTSASPAVIGFSMTSSTTLCTALLYIVFLSSLLQVEMNCFQRIEEYIHAIPQERNVTSGNDSSVIVADWPCYGYVKFRNITAGYTLDGDAVLSNINLEAKPGQRVAIVGRSGSGKSSLAATLLRLTEKFEGQVLIDDVDIDAVDSLELRQRICFIPQSPTFFTGTLRFNLDFSGKVSDERLEQVVSEVMSGIGKKREWTLDMEIAAEGMNLSQGERQLISLARALVTDARIVLIDEATASLDAESEEEIQRLLKERFSNKTLISIAHRLAPIAQYDWVCVMSRGRIIEQGDPKKLLDVEGGELSKLWRAVNS